MLLVMFIMFVDYKTLGVAQLLALSRVVTECSRGVRIFWMVHSRSLSVVLGIFCNESWEGRV